MQKSSFREKKLKKLRLKILMTIVADSSPIIALARASKLYLLKDLFGQVLIPDGVYKELAQKGRAGAEEVRRGLFFKRERVRNQDTLSRLAPFVGRVDAEALTLAIEKRAKKAEVILLTDDLRLIRQAKEEGITAVTTRMVLLEAKTKGFLASVKETLDEMRRQGIGIPDDIYEDTLKQAGEK